MSQFKTKLGEDRVLAVVAVVVDELVQQAASVHLLPPVAIHAVAFSGISFFIPDSYGAFIKASLEIHALITSPSYRFGIAMCLSLIHI